MSWLYSQALVEEYLAANCLDGEQSAPLSGSHTQQAYCAPDKMTAFSRLSRFGMTYKPLMEHHGEALLKSYLAAFHAKIFQQPEKVQELMENVPECGEKWRGSFVKYDPDSSLWRTHQCSLLGDLDEFLETWPQWGLMRDGECWEQRTLERLTRGTESGLLPTPNAFPCGPSKDYNPKAKSQSGRNLQSFVAKFPSPVSSDTSHRKNKYAQGGTALSTKIGGQLNPTWVEWLMGWPLGWTDLKPLEMDKSHCVQPQHGEYSQKDN